jgi:hypothetical protein
MLLITIRYGLPALMFVGALVMLFVADDRTIGLEGFAMGTGGALALLLMNLLWRFGFSGDKDRQDEEDARNYLTKHGRWPDDPEDDKP